MSRSTGPRMLLLAALALNAAAGSGCTEKATQRSKADVTPNKTAKTPPPRKTPPRRVAPPRATTPAPGPAALRELMVDKSSFAKPILARRPTPLGGARYIVIAASMVGERPKRGLPAAELRAVIIDKLGGWKVAGTVKLPAPGALMPEAPSKDAKKAGAKGPNKGVTANKQTANKQTKNATAKKAAGRLGRRIRAGLRLRDVDGDGKLEAVVRYRYPTAGDVLEGYTLLNLEGAPKVAFSTIFSRIDPKTGGRKQLARISFGDFNADGHPDLRVTVRGGGQTMTSSYRYDKKRDTYLPSSKRRTMAAPRSKSKKGAPPKARPEKASKKGPANK